MVINVLQYMQVIFQFKTKLNSIYTNLCVCLLWSLDMNPNQIDDSQVFPEISVARHIFFSTL
jgi:hypothetical protein